jgi:hypothetical protein
LKNKVTKILITLSSFLMLAVLVLLFKIQGDNQKNLENKEEDATANSSENLGKTNSGPTETFPIDSTPVVDNTPVTTPAKITTPASVAPAPVAKPTKKTRTS